jgi:hypothetical protein
MIWCFRQDWGEREIPNEEPHKIGGREEIVPKKNMLVFSFNIAVSSSSQTEAAAEAAVVR